MGREKASTRILNHGEYHFLLSSTLENCIKPRVAWFLFVWWVVLFCFVSSSDGLRMQRHEVKTEFGPEKDGN